MAVDPRIAVNPTLHAALQYQSCAHCYYVGKANENWSRSDLACPRCGALGSPRIFPGDLYSLHMFPNIQQLYEERNRFTEFIIVVSMFITESILYTTAQLALRKLGVQAGIAKHTLSVFEGSQDIAEYLAKLCKAKSIPKILRKSAELKAAWDQWEQSRTLRNKIAHGIRFFCTVEDAERAFEVAVKFPAVARHILNQVSGTIIRHYPAIIEGGAKTGYSVFFPDLPGCTSGGETLQAAALNAEEALAGHIDRMLEAGEVLPEPSVLDTRPRPVEPDVVEAARLLVRVGVREELLA